MEKTIRYRGGEPLMHWLYAGPFITDVSSLYFDNYVVPVEPYLPFITEAKGIALKDPPAEGEAMEFLGALKEWAWLRAGGAEKKIIWASMGTSARLMVNYGYTRILRERGGTCRFTLDLTGAGAVFVNGRLVFEVLQVGRVSGTWSFEAELLPGENHCRVVLANVHLHCVNSFSLLSEEDCVLALPLLAGGERDLIEEDFGKFFLEEDLLEPGGEAALKLSGPPASPGSFVVTLASVPAGQELEGKPLLRRVFRLAGKGEKIVLCPAAALDQDPAFRGAYRIQVDYEVPGTGGAPRRIRGPGFSFFYAEFFDPGETEAPSFPERQRRLLRCYGALPESEDRTIPHRELARLLGSGEAEPNAAALERGLEYINQRYDCADFSLHGLLRLYHLCRKRGGLDAALEQKVRDCILGFKYWTDEPGRSMMFTRSENHEFLFFSAEYLAGLLFPGEVFPNSAQNGLFHILKGRLNAERWIKEKGRYGFMEWHSNCYYEEDMLALLNIYDFGEENAPIRILAKNLLDLICFIIASHHYQGILATTHGRSYERMIIHPELESMSHINWLLFGKPDKLHRHLSIGALALASSSYRPDPLFGEIAGDSGELYTESRMGLFPHSGTGGVNCASFRCEAYMVSGMVESKAGEAGHQVHAGQVILEGKLPVFVSCFDNKSEHTRPSYWGGQYQNPKTVVYKNLLAYIYRIKGSAGFTHCYFPFLDFDESAVRGKWYFGRKNRACIALYSLKPLERTREGTYRDRELICMEKNNIWFIEMARLEDHGGFERFQAAILEAPLREEGEDLFFRSPSQGPLELGWSRVCTVKGRPVLESPFPLIRNRYGSAEYGSGLCRLGRPGEGAGERTLNFNF